MIVYLFFPKGSSRVQVFSHLSDITCVKMGLKAGAYRPLLINSRVISGGIDLYRASPLTTKPGLQSLSVDSRLNPYKAAQRVVKENIVWTCPGLSGTGRLLCQKESVPTCLKIWLMLPGSRFVAAFCTTSKHPPVKWLQRGKLSLTLFLLWKHNLRWARLPPSPWPLNLSLSVTLAVRICFPSLSLCLSCSQASCGWLLPNRSTYVSL